MNPSVQVGELLLLRAVESVDRTGTADSRNTALLRLLVDDANELRADHVVAKLALDDTRAEALVHELTASCLPALQVFARALGRPLPRELRVVAAVQAPLDELAD